MKFYADDDSKAFNDVQHVYGDENVKKQECIGHYQKRVGSRLRKLKKREKGLKELREPIIDKLHNYFGISLRSNLNTVEQMQNTIWASLLHVSSSEKKNFHDYCEKSSSSWCQYPRDQINDTNFYKPGRGLSQNVIKTVKPIYLDLINPVELKKCLHGLTQNQNGSFTSMIWESAAKTTYCGYEKLEFAVYDACAHLIMADKQLSIF